MIQQLPDNRVFIDHGPTQMVIDVYVGDKRVPEIGVITAERVISQLEELAVYLPQLSKMRTYRKTSDEFPKVLNKMIVAVEQSGYQELNTLGAVAGSFSDLALEYALELGGTRVIINNGGDLALTDLTGKDIKVGIPLYKDADKGQLILTITKEMNIHGICTSGIGGRSFTKGIATAAVALGENAAIADACATYLGNMTNIDDDNIVRCLAEEIDSGTDIPGQMVTLKVGQINEKNKYKALFNGLSAAEDLYKRGIISGAIICIGNDIVKFPDNLNVSFV
ncbi:ApbE superfamily uncharacterized protein (UPF0280 family) [Sedimentibacter acidaminivorans]|uniref:ApbE superfamily uncharacterized protein (UPF0280 family) n=1 Tax=Sedimentibacter acidaminivorans TaxID=913099 RepID=A0ABS4GE06_9FIRM|nr:UPF0280 family protein [Sedimentibacter acidaminivorans]MBP1925877.1 ApbE superfamily uncharacterized protein (UPF0280 family) [Sedimentibacter acidaminivorans]